MSQTKTNRCLNRRCLEFDNASNQFAILFQNEYFKLYPRGLSPVLFNDVVYAIHAALAEFVIITQCVMYEVRISVALDLLIYSVLCYF